MARTLLLGSVAVTMLAFTGQHCRAQAPLPHPRFGIVNMEFVCLKYEKAVALREEAEKRLKPFRVKAERIKRDILALQQLTKEPGEGTNSDEHKMRIVALKRALEGLDEEARKKLAPLHEAEMEIMEEIEKCAEAFGRTTGCVLVARVGEPSLTWITAYGHHPRGFEGILYSDVKDARNVEAWPVCDFSDQVATKLNTAYQAQKKQD